MKINREIIPLTTIRIQLTPDELIDLKNQLTEAVVLIHENEHEYNVLNTILELINS